MDSVRKERLSTKGIPLSTDTADIIALMALTARGEWIAARPFSSGTSVAGRLSRIGGTLSLTDDALVFDPLWRLGRRREYRLRDILAVDEFADKPPRMRVALRTGRPVVFAVLPTRSTSMWSSDTSARDDAVAAVDVALSELEHR